MSVNKPGNQLKEWGISLTILPPSPDCCSALEAPMRARSGDTGWGLPGGWWGPEVAPCRHSQECSPTPCLVRLWPRKVLRQCPDSPKSPSGQSDPPWLPSQNPPKIGHPKCYDKAQGPSLTPSKVAPHLTSGQAYRGARMCSAVCSGPKPTFHSTSHRSSAPQLWPLPLALGHYPPSPSLYLGQWVVMDLNL